MGRRPATLLAIALGVWWLLGTRGSPSWYEDLAQARAEAGERIVVAVIHDPGRLAAEEAFLRLRGGGARWPELAGRCVMVPLRPDQAPDGWGLREAGFAVRAMEPDGTLLAQRDGILEPEEFLRFLDGVQSLRGVRGEASLEQARHLLALGCHDQARAAFQEVLALPDRRARDTAEAHAWLALCLARQGQSGRAREHLQRVDALAEVPELEPLCLLVRAEVAHVEREEAEARRLLGRLIEEWPRSGFAAQARRHRADWAGPGTR